MNQVRTRPHKLGIMAQEQGTTVVALVKAALLASGSIQGAAMELGVTPTAIRHHMKMNGLSIIERRTVEIVEDTP